MLLEERRQGRKLRIEIARKPLGDLSAQLAAPILSAVRARRYRQWRECREQRVELAPDTFGPGDDERFERVELEGRASDQCGEVGGRAGEEPDPPVFK